MRLRSGFALLLAIAAGAHPAAAQPNALALLHAAVEAPRLVSYEGQVQLLTIGTQGSEASIFRVEHRAPGLTRRTYISPPNLYGDWSVARGDATYAVDVKHKRVFATLNESFGMHFGWSHDLGLLTRNYKAVIGPDAHVAGRMVHTIALVNRYTGLTTMRLWVDVETNLMLQRQLYATNGGLVTEMRFDDVTFTNAIADSTFNLPKGYPIVLGPERGLPSEQPGYVVAHCGFTAHTPSYLPRGFKAVTADVADENGVHTLHVLYSDGLRTISLFENARGAAVDMTGYHPASFAIGALHGQWVDRGPTTLLAWSQSGLHYALVGDATRAELEKIAVSL